MYLRYICLRHYPIGLLHDLYSGPESLPWTLSLHFQDLPSDVLLLKPTPENMQDMFMSMVKEVDHKTLGSFFLLIFVRQTFFEMEALKKSQTFRNETLRNYGNLLHQVFICLCTFVYLNFCVYIDEYDDFRAVNKHLVEYSNSLRHIPLKIYLPDNCPVIQELVSFEGNACTL